MDYYINLAVEQNERWLKYRQLPENQKKSEIEMRLAFFGSKYEVHISYSITNGIASFKSYNDLHHTNL